MISFILQKMPYDTRGLRKRLQHVDVYDCSGRTVERTGWQPPTCSPPTAGDLIRRYMDMTDFTYTINTASKTVQRLFDIVSTLLSACSSLAGHQFS